MASRGQNDNVRPRPNRAFAGALASAQFLEFSRAADASGSKQQQLHELVFMPNTSTEAAGASASLGHASLDRRRLFALALGSVGVVFGDIGTSPLYAFRESIYHASGDGLTRDEIIGTVSLLLWALIIVITVKYVLFIMRADNKGEGGLLALMALAQGKRTNLSIVFILGIIGASLFYGDAVLTPAISVLSAVEGLKLVTPVFEPFVIPITLAILIGLFAVQSHGTHRVRFTVRSDHGAVVHRHCRLRRLAHRRRRRDSAGLQSAERRVVYAVPRLDCLCGSGLGISGHHRRRSAVRRYGPFWPAAHPPGVAVFRLAGAWR